MDTSAIGRMTVSSFRVQRLLMAKPYPNVTNRVMVTLSGWLCRLPPLIALHNKPFKSV
jgi:hypothetical protein